jgi:hypothetical protein
MSAAAKGPIRPNSMRFSETARPMVPRDQPNSSCRGSMSTPGVDRNPAAARRVKRDTEDDPGVVASSSRHEP